MNYRAKAEWKARVIWEKTIEAGKQCFLVIYGQHINGYFIAIPNWGVCIESSEAEDTRYNADRLERAGFSFAQAASLAAGIADANLRR